MLDINVLAVMLACHEIVPIMKAQGGGHIVNLSSVAGRQVKAGYSGYNASKWAVGAFSVVKLAGYALSLSIFGVARLVLAVVPSTAVGKVGRGRSR